MKASSLFLCVFLLMPFSYLYARDSIIFCQVGERDPALWNMVKKYFTGKGYGVSIYEGADSIEKQVANANRMNREKAALLMAIELAPSDTENIFVAISNAKKGRGAILEIDEVPAAHGVESEELAQDVATPFGKKVKRIPVFVLLGVDMPGVFLRIDCPRDKIGEVLNKLDQGIQKYLKRGVKNESER
ncbi:MAG TPA: hypothetical protein VMT62_10870 [Syntrophorhabdaceae bacterium]|nr:hypothetical protein [Syntrophorhabdaceae bacterium]